MQKNKNKNEYYKEGACCEACPFRFFISACLLSYQPTNFSYLIASLSA